MIKFITNNTDYKSKHLDIIQDATRQRQVLETLFGESFKHYDNVIAIDTETTELDPYYSDLLLISMGNTVSQVVIDCTTVKLLDIFPNNYQDYIYLGHNIKFDYKIIKVNANIEMTKYYDVMIAEQKIWQNAGFKMKLDEVIYRNLGYYPQSMDKNVRLDFVGRNPNNFKATINEIKYTASDVAYLHSLRNKQLEHIKKYQLEWFLTNVEFPLIQVLAEMELKGIEIDVPKWKQVIADNITKRFELETALDAEVNYLKNTICDDNSRLYITAGKYGRKRKQQQVPKQFSLFGESTIVKNWKPNKANVNYNSSDEIIKIFAVCTQPLSVKDEDKYYIPILNKTTGKIEKEKGKVPDSGNLVRITGWETNKVAFTQYLIDFPKSPMKDFINLIVKYSTVIKELSTYGESFISYINTKTNRLHTNYKQAFTANGRLSSGGGRSQKDKPNLQNIPRNNKFRHCFIDDGKWLITCDLTGAEVVNLCDKANDTKLYEWAVVQDDAHSPIATATWRSIWYYRAGLAAGYWKDYYTYIKNRKKYAHYFLVEKSPKVEELYNNSQKFTINKKVNQPYRQTHKNLTFGSIYGCKPKKAAQTLNGTTGELRKIDSNAKPVNVTIEEGKVALRTMKETIPRSFETVETNVKKAFNQGYLILNSRSKSRVWFSAVIKILGACHDTINELKESDGSQHDLQFIENGKYTLSSGDEFELNWKDVKDIDGQARNLPISGTQADQLKEAMVVFYHSCKHHNLDFTLLLQVHDELCASTNYENNLKLNLQHSHIQNQVVAELPHFEGKAHDYLKFVMVDVANRYLDNVKMKADYDVAKHWLK